MGTDANVDEVDDAARRAQSVEKIADRAAANEGDRCNLETVLSWCLPVHVGENEQRAEREEHEPPAR